MVRVNVEGFGKGKTIEFVKEIRRIDFHDISGVLRVSYDTSDNWMAHIRVGHGYNRNFFLRVGKTVRYKHNAPNEPSSRCMCNRDFSTDQ